MSLPMFAAREKRIEISTPRRDAAMIIVVSGQASGPFCPRLFNLCLLYLWRDGANDRLCHLILQVKDILQSAIHLFGPKVGACLRIH